MEYFSLWSRLRFPNSSGVNTPIPKIQIEYKESTALASLYFNIKFLKSLALYVSQRTVK